MRFGDVPQRALIITPSFFGYESDIVDEFELQGFVTTYVDERPSNSTLARALLRVRKNLIEHRIDRYYKSKYAQLKGIKFDVVLVVRAEATPAWFLEEIRHDNPDAYFVFYIWDAISKASNCLKVLHLFDSRYSFDPSDVASYPDLSYLPLFYTPDFSALPPQSNETREYTLSFVGTLHPGRYSYVKKLFAGRSRTFAFIYVQARWYFWVVKYITREHRDVAWSDVSFTKLSRSNVADVFRNSAAVLDMPQPDQAGLTIRTFEVLASASVLVTTNRSIIREPFFDASRVIVVSSLDEDSLKQLHERIDALSPLADAPYGFETYSLASWVRKLTSREGAGTVEQ